MVYVEIFNEEGLKVVPFQYIANSQYSRQYTDEINNRPSPDHYVEQGDRVFTLGPLVISKALMSVGK